MGISQDDYKQHQASKDEDDFKTSINKKMQRLILEIDMLNNCLDESIAQQGSFEVECKTEINEILNLTTLSLKEFRQSLGDVLTEFIGYEKKFNNMQISIESKVHVSDFNEKISRLEQMIENLHKEKASIRNDFIALVQRLSKDFDNKLIKLKDEILAMPSEIPHLKKFYDQKIELVELNGQNGVLRSSNNEKQIMLLERKIENIYQLIKKLEIAKE